MSQFAGRVKLMLAMLTLITGFFGAPVRAQFGGPGSGLVDSDLRNYHPTYPGVPPIQPGPMADTQSVQSVNAYVSVPSGDYILHSGIPGCGANPWNGVKAAANFIAGVRTGGMIGALVAIVSEIGHSGRVGGSAGEILEGIYGPRLASCAPVSVVIPAGSRILGVEYRARDAHYGDRPCDRDGNGWIVCGIGWSSFDPIQVTAAGDSMIVTAIFKNWSADLGRDAAITVHWVAPSRYGY
jgi:hypothetical protein